MGGWKGFDFSIRAGRGGVGGGGGGGGGGRRFVRVWKPVVPRPWFRRMPISIRPFLDRISMGAVRVLTRFQEVGRVWSRV